MDDARRTSALISAAVTVGCVIVPRLLNIAPAARIQQALNVSTWAVTAGVALALMCCGIRGAMPVLRRAGLALLTLTAAPVLRATQALPPDQPSLTSSALGLAGVAMLLTTAVPFAVDALRTVWRELADSQSRLDAAETAIAHNAVRDHEMRNLVADLSGAENVLAAREGAEHSAETLSRTAGNSARPRGPSWNGCAGCWTAIQTRQTRALGSHRPGRPRSRWVPC